VADLRWLKPTSALISKDTPVRSGSQVYAEGRHYEPGVFPDEFNMYRTYGRLRTRYLRMRNKPVRSQLDPPLDAIPMNDTTVMSQPWIVPIPRRHHAMPVYAVDSLGNQSYAIKASSVASIAIAPTITIAGSGGSLGEVKVVASVDPVIDFTVLLPWETGLQNILDEMAEELYVDFGLIEATGRERASLYDHVAWAMAPEPPSGWWIDLAVPRASLDAGERLTFGIKFRTPTLGVSAFAIQAAATIDGEVETVVSDVMVIESDGDGPGVLSYL
jgi:hypothetical protein